MSFKRSLNHIILLLALLISSSPMARAAFLLIPMDKSQTNHLKAYGIAYWSIERGAPLEWLLNYRGGSFLVGFDQIIEQECLLRGVKIEVIADAARLQILEKIAQPNVNMDAVKMEKAPKIAVYAPEDKQPWDDAVMMALEYAEIPYEQIYDGEILDGKLKEYDWLHLHHEDFTGQYGRFYRAFNHMVWYQKQVAENEAMATRYGFQKVSQMKLQVALTIKAYVANGGFLFSMCSGADSFDIALASEGIDICAQMYDGDPVDPEANSKLDFSKTLAFHNFKLIENPLEYEFSTIDATQSRRITENQDYFTLFEFSAKWDPVPTMLCQNHTQIIKGFMGQTTAFLSQYVKPTIVVMGENKSLGETRYIHGEYGQGTWTFYGGHDPEDYQHLVGDPPTDLSLYPNSPGYRLILNNILFPAARKKKLKT
ncbi:MAG: asparagine synthetase B [Bacteroidales bacterium]|nr:asparagine synthetase B [Bacteroidales bacterium]MDD2570002.1 asparagine synthetase B [Bacteroidales bacterium]MDD2812267.1 asparagine synthetase B [Bacteroidales bacterium]MDD3385460.1 asparagine synthetase B [Bacteroidales bacterium]MDD3811904.1 asparagine synthetase B [Bacteroidales bacterium]